MNEDRHGNGSETGVAAVRVRDLTPKEIGLLAEALVKEAGAQKVKSAKDTPLPEAPEKNRDTSADDGIGGK